MIAVEILDERSSFPVNPPEVPVMRPTRVRFTVRRMMVAVAVSAVALGFLVLAHREVNYRICLVEAENYHYRAQEETDPARKAEYARLATEYDRLKRYYRPDR
jgi:hypothetical protein